MVVLLRLLEIVMVGVVVVDCGCLSQMVLVGLRRPVQQVFLLRTVRQLLLACQRAVPLVPMQLPL